jgi:hypothetical protein
MKAHDTPSVALDGSPSLLDSPLIHDGSPSLLDSPLIYDVDGSPSLLDSEESKADENPSTVAVAKSAIKSNPMTRSSTHQRQAKRPTVDSPTMPFLSLIKKRRLHVEESREVVNAVAEKKVFSPKDLLVPNGFKKSDYYTDQPCLVPNCKDPACVFGHTCKCNRHNRIGAVLKSKCFSQFKNGLRTSSCLYRSKLDRINAQGRAEVKSTDSFAFFETLE